MRGKLIWFEFVGVWGSGKSTSIELLESGLTKKNYKIATIHTIFGLPKLVKIYEIFMLFLISPMTLVKFIKLFFVTRKYVLKGCNSLNKGVFSTMLKTYLFRQIIIRRKLADIVLWEGEFHLLTLILKSKDSNNELYVYLRKLFELKKIEFTVINVNQICALNRIYSDIEKGKNIRFTIEAKEGLEESMNSIERNQNLMLSSLAEFGCSINHFHSNEKLDFSDLIAHVESKLA